ncbi:hypothetical protein GHT07_06780 [Caenimonas koreensis DSM 17982]|uniref:Uncharacterized protein n=1 Tax=Caenimonas koreensis DSM 17982 TaxID=1121255 RepID=A0A844ART7_9BURK|nr:hypothetical protein [Caenimonas koreensis]MRD46975.1 hypothetical protein [Caenimonas koreensis DSM 17982]
MKREELESKLTALDVKPNSYSLGSIRHSDCVCEVDDGGRSKVYYVERDKPDELGVFDAVETAYDFVYAIFCNWMGVKA